MNLNPLKSFKIYFRIPSFPSAPQNYDTQEIILSDYQQQRSVQTNAYGKRLPPPPVFHNREASVHMVQVMPKLATTQLHPNNQSNSLDLNQFKFYQPSIASIDSSYSKNTVGFQPITGDILELTSTDDREYDSALNVL